MIQETNIKGITNSLFTDIQKSLIEKAMKEYTELKCKELLEIVAGKADEAHVGGWELDRDEVLNAVNLKEFIQ
jgi:hypothetical protein